MPRHAAPADPRDRLVDPDLIPTIATLLSTAQTLTLRPIPADAVILQSAGRHAKPRDGYDLTVELDALADWLSVVLRGLGMSLAYRNRDHLLDAIGVEL